MLYLVLVPVLFYPPIPWYKYPTYIYTPATSRQASEERPSQTLDPA